MSLIRTRNLLHENVPFTRFYSTEEAGTNVIRVENTTALTNSWAVQLGETGHEQTEVVIGTVASGTEISLANTSFPHPVDTPVYFIKYNQVVFERSTTNGTLGTASPIANGTVTYQPDSFFTIFDDTSGSSSYGYRTYFRNSILTVNSTESDWITFAGNDFYSLGKIRSRIRNKLWNAEWLTDEALDEWINECKDKMTNRIIQTNEDYALGTVNVGFGTDGLGTIPTTDFNQVRRVWITYDGINTYQSTKMNVNIFIPNQVFSSSHPYHAWIGDTILKVSPSTQIGTAQLIFYRFGTVMVNDTDVLPLPMRPYTDIFTEYARAQAYLKENKNSEADPILNRVGTMIEDFTLNLAPRDKSGPTMVQIVEPI